MVGVVAIALSRLPESSPVPVDAAADAAAGVGRPGAQLSFHRSPTTDAGPAEVAAPAAAAADTTALALAEPSSTAPPAPTAPAEVAAPATTAPAPAAPPTTAAAPPPPVAVASAAAPVTTAPPTTAPPAPPPARPDTTAALLACIRQYEGAYTSVNPDGPYYGAYQFSQGSWDDAVTAAGHPEWAGRLPSDAPPAIQDEAALALLRQRGLDPWPTPAEKCQAEYEAWAG